MLDTFVNFVLGMVSDMGYTGIVVLMAMESSFIPFPSEVVVPPAGYLAAQGEMNIYLVILSGIAGSLIGAIINYYIAVFAGRAFLAKYGKYFFFTPERLDNVDTYFSKHGEITTFVGRLIPAVRQYISFPAGLGRMSIPKFCFFTSLGAGIWVVVLAWVGYVVGNNIELIKSNLQPITIVTLLVLTVIVAVYILFQKKRGKKDEAAI